MSKRRIVLLFAVALLAVIGGYAGVRSQSQEAVRVRPPYQRPQEILDEIKAGNLRALQDKGTTMGPAPTLDAPLDVQQEIAAVFQAEDVRPADRAKHMKRWLEDERVKCVGWFGMIQKIELTADGALVTVRVAPRLVTRSGGPASTQDNVIETWEYKDGKLKYIKGEQGPAQHRLLMVD